MLKVQLYAVQAEFNPCNSKFEGNLVALSHDTELFMDSQGLPGQVITVVSSGHVPMLKLFKALILNSKSNTLHTQWTVLIPILKPLNPIFVT